MIEAYDNYSARAEGKAFFMGPYLDDAGRPHVSVSKWVRDT